MNTQDIIRTWIFLTVSAIVLFSCEQNRETNDFEGDDEIRVAIGDISDPDNTIVSLRVMAFDPSSGICKSNKRYDTYIGEVIIHTISNGTYDFVFLGNEPTGTIRTALDNTIKRTDLDGIAYPHTLFTSDQPIPMIQTVENVTVLRENKGVSIAGGQAINNWVLALERLGARIDIVLTAREDLSTAFTGVRFGNIPDKVPLTSGYTGTIARNITREFQTGNSSDQGYFEDITLTLQQQAAGAVWGKKITRVILPSSVFTPKTSAGSAVTFTVLLHDQFNPSCTMGVNETANPADYTLPPNNHLDCEGDIITPLVLSIKASEWNTSGINGSIPENRMLNISKIETSITPTGGSVISFWSNMPNVSIESKGRFISGGTGEFNVDDYYKGLTGNTPTHFQYSYNSGTRRGEGTMTVMLNTPPSDGNPVQAIVLNAGGLRREIKLNTQIWGTQSPYKYAGTFHRASEAGERVIAFNNTGTWSATVSYTTEQAAKERFVILSSTPSSDPMIGTDTPGDPELYPVIPTGDGQTVSGNGKIYFRVGMRSKLSQLNPDYSTQPRYAVITITHTEGPTTLYVRQGEAPDYVMRRNEPGTTMVSRPVAIKWSPYNLTAQAFVDGTNSGGTSVTGHPQPAVNGGVFTKYPTQAGAFFQWAVPTTNTVQIRRAFHPFNPQGQFSGTYGEANGNNWFFRSPVTGIEGFWPTLKTTNETCPPGYKRPNDGPIDKGVPRDGSQTSESEVRQSLFLVPPMIATESRLENCKEGYYADGFFDRRRITDYMGLSNLRVAGNAEVAYLGSLYFNPATYAAIFLPHAGRRYFQNGILQPGTGSSGWYSTSTKVDKDDFWFLVIGDTTYGSSTIYGSNGIAISVRCVQE